MLAKIVALVAHEIVTEYRKLDSPAAPASGGSHSELSCVCATTERAATWDHDTKPPVTARVVGFSRRRDGAS
jgi:hypothetical protein